MVILNINVKCLVFLPFFNKLIFLSFFMDVSRNSSHFNWDYSPLIYSSLKHYLGLYTPTGIMYSLFHPIIPPNLSQPNLIFHQNKRIINNNLYLDSKSMLVMYLLFSLYFILHSLPIYLHHPLTIQTPSMEI